MRKLSLLLAFTLLLSFFNGVFPSQRADAAFTNFITRSGDELRDGSALFQVVGFNIPGIMVHKDKGYYDHHDDWELEDLLLTCSQMGVSAVRSYTFPIGKSVTGDFAYVTGIRTYDETNLRRLDKFLQMAQEYDIRVIIPFIDCWSFKGGITEFSGFRGKTANQFFSDATLKQDFKNFMYDILNRTNYYTGVQYKNDKTIMAWELGNELDGNGNWSGSWEVEMASYIKTVDENHLVISSAHSRSVPDTTILNSSSVDILNAHPYSYFGRPLNTVADAYIAGCNGKKPFILGEYDDSQADNISTMLSKIKPNTHFAGAFAWSLRGHTSIGGFYKHYEGEAGWYAYNWPGNSIGENTNYEMSKMNDLRYYAYQVKGLAKPPLPAPAAPVILDTSTKTGIKLKGGTGALTYEIQRSLSQSGNWTTITTSYSDYGQSYSHDVLSVYCPYSDTTAPVGTVYYRARGVNSEGLYGPYSNIIAVGDAQDSNPIPLGVERVDDNFSALTYSGGWTHSLDPNFYNNTKTVSNTTGDYAQLTFNGSSIKAYAKKLAAGGKFDIYIDSVYTATIDTYSPTEVYMAKVFEKNNLDSGTHTIRLVLNGQKNASSSGYWVGLDYFEYDKPGLLYDDFSDGDYSRNPEWTVESGNFSVVADGNNYVNSSTGGSTGLITAGSTLWENYTYQARLKLNAEGVDGSLWFRCTDSRNSYVCKLFNDSTDTIELWKNLNGTGTKIAAAPTSINNSTWYTLKVVVNGSRIKCYLEDILMLDVVDETFSNGKIGVKIYDGSAYYDDVSVIE